MAKAVARGLLQPHLQVLGQPREPEREVRYTTALMRRPRIRVMPCNTGYERLLQSIGRVTARDIERLTERFTLAGDARDVLAARDSLISLLGLWPYQSRA